MHTNVPTSTTTANPDETASSTSAALLSVCVLGPGVHGRFMLNSTRPYPDRVANELLAGAGIEAQNIINDLRRLTQIDEPTCVQELQKHAGLVENAAVYACMFLDDLGALDPTQLHAEHVILELINDLGGQLQRFSHLPGVVCSARQEVRRLVNTSSYTCFEQPGLGPDFSRGQQQISAAFENEIYVAARVFPSTSYGALRFLEYVVLQQHLYMGDLATKGLLRISPWVQQWLETTVRDAVYESLPPEYGEVPADTLSSALELWDPSDDTAPFHSMRAAVDAAKLLMQ